MRGVLDDMMGQFKEEVITQVQNLHLDMIRQFHNQQAEITQLLDRLSVQNQLLEENRKLREENERLRKMY
jgi:protein NEDD1